MHWLSILSCFTMFKCYLNVTCNTDHGANLSLFAIHARFWSRNLTKCLMKLFFDLSSRKIFHIEAIGTNDMIRPGCTSTRYDGQRIFVLSCVCDNQDYCNNLFTDYLEKQPISNKTREIIEINKALRGYLYGTIKVDKLRGTVSLLSAIIVLWFLVAIVLGHFLITVYFLGAIPEKK
ncbi:hypothetical protein RB195_020699 [Necator americanus]|uniref:Uncharacterized protein n=1 Tax=Necator americanus TaxID=51031 RepID=A0ABR1CKX9_NECAM